MTKTRAFGMIPSGEDPRDIVYQGQHVGMAAIPDSYELPNKPLVMDQGSAPICAAISIASILEWQNMAKTSSSRGKVYDAYQIYNMREDKEMQGMVPRDALNKVKKLGVNGDKIDEFARVTNYDMLKMSVLCNGPVMIGTNAYEDPTYFWRPTKNLLGGHAVIVVGWDEEGYILQNSWGTGYGYGGRITMPYSDQRYILEAWTITM